MFFQKCSIFKMIIIAIVMLTVMTINNGNNFGVNGHYVYWEYSEIPRPQKRLNPCEIMVDITNDLSYKILYYHSLLNRKNNFAFSPTSLASVLIALYEGSGGLSSTEIRRVLRLPWNRDIVRIGYRDVHRRLRTYFFNQENPLTGLSLNRENVLITPEYETILHFYGYDFNTLNKNATPGSTSTTTTTTTEASTVATSSTTEPVVNTTPASPPLTPAAQTANDEEDRTTTVENEASPTSTTTEINTENPDKTTVSNREATLSNEETTLSNEETTLSNEATTPAIVEETTIEAEKNKETTTMPSSTDAANLEESSPLRVTTTVKPEEVSTQTETTTEITTEIPTTTTEYETTTTNFPLTTIIPNLGTSRTFRPLIRPAIPIVGNRINATGTTLPISPSSAPLIRTTMGSNSGRLVTPSMLTTDERDQELFPLSRRRRPSVPETGINNPNNSRLKRFLFPHYFHKPAYEVTYGVNHSPLTVFADDHQNNLPDQHITIYNLPNSDPYLSLSPENRQQIYQYTTVEKDTTPSSHKTHEKKNTIDHIFYLNSFETIQAKYKIYNSILNYGYIPEIKSAALELELDSNDYDLLLLVPDYNFELEYLLSSLRFAPTLRKIKRSLKLTWVQAIIPDFQMRGNIYLTNDLQNMGINEIFEPYRANFAPMTEDKCIYVRHIEQYVDVHIRTNPIDQLKRNIGPYNRPVEISVNHPFLYFIIDKEMDIAIMAGAVLNPLNVRVQ